MMWNVCMNIASEENWEIVDVNSQSSLFDSDIFNIVVWFVKGLLIKCKETYIAIQRSVL